MMTTLIRSLSLCAASLFVVASALAQAPKVAFPQVSQKCVLTQTVGVTDIEITYFRPAVNGREVFGQLEPYGVVWRTGANNATKIKFSTPVKFGGKEVAAGEYALFSIPGASEWTVILNQATGDWGAYKYDEKNDVVRVTTTATKLTEPVESFTIEFNDVHAGWATLNLMWKNTRVPVKIENDTVAQVVKQIEAAMASDTKPGAGLYDQSAMFYLYNDLDLEKAAQWEKTATEMKPTFSNIYHLAMILEKKGDKAGAAVAANKSLELVGNAGAAKDEYTRLNKMLLARLGQ
jgi:hypothetical protein